MTGSTAPRSTGTGTCLVRWALLVLGGLLLALVCVGSAAADPTPVPSPSPPVSDRDGGSPAPTKPKAECALLVGDSKQICIDGTTGKKTPAVPDLPGPANAVLHPIDALAEACSEAAVWFTDKLAKALIDPSRVDMTNAGFLRNYAVAFAAATFMTLILWVLAVAKRAVRGVPIMTALGEAIGYLWLVVTTSAFLPVGMFLAVSMVDSITEAVSTNTKANTTTFLTGVSKGLEPTGGLGGGPVVLILASGLTMIAAVALWVELLVRDAMIYIGAILAPLVFSGLVDKNLWSSVRRWVGLMVAILLAKPIMVIVLGLGLAVGSGDTSDDPIRGVLMAITIMGLAVMCGVACYRWVPGVGDEIGRIQYDRKSSTMPAGLPGSGSSGGGAIGTIRQGLSAHSARTAAAAKRSSASGGSSGSKVGAGVAAHGNRTSRQPPTPPPSAPATGSNSGSGSP